MLLAVLGMAEAGDLVHNKIRFDPALIERYMKFFAAVRSESDHANPHYPYGWAVARELSGGADCFPLMSSGY